MFYSIKNLRKALKGSEEKHHFLHRSTYEISIFKGFTIDPRTLSFKVFFKYVFECENLEVGIMNLFDCSCLQLDNCKHYQHINIVAMISLHVFWVVADAPRLYS